MSHIYTASKCIKTRLHEKGRTNNELLHKWVNNGRTTYGERVTKPYAGGREKSTTVTENLTKSIFECLTLRSWQSPRPTGHMHVYCINWKITQNLYVKLIISCGNIN